MKELISHLPEHKRAELELIKDAILEKIPDVRMIILFGSYARGDWVEDTHIEDNAIHVYESDFDILVATRDKKTAEDSNIHDRVEKAIEATDKVKTPYNIIYHSFGYIDEMISQGHYFFCDIKKEGIQLYRKHGKFDFSKIKILTSAQRKQIAQEHFNQWFEKAKDSYLGYEMFYDKERYNEAAFNLHQSTERLYSAICLVFVNYRFRTHDIEKLNRKAISYNSEFGNAFPLDTSEQKNNFKLLKHAYIDARYKDSYEITAEQLQYLAARVKC